MLCSSKLDKIHTFLSLVERGLEIKKPICVFFFLLFVFFFTGVIFKYNNLVLNFRLVAG